MRRRDRCYFAVPYIIKNEYHAPLEQFFSKINQLSAFSAKTKGINVQIKCGRAPWKRHVQF